MPKPVLAIRHVPFETLGTLEHYLDDAGVGYEYLDMFGPPTVGLLGFEPSQWSGLVILGGPMNVDETDKYPFLADELTWIRQAIDAKLPLLGICLGSQLIAKALGSRVFANAVKEIGWYPITFTDEAENDPLFADSAPLETVFQWHGDTFDLPAGATLLAMSDQCRNQAFRFGDRTYALQFHLEVTPAMVDDWLAQPTCCAELSRLDYIHPQAILAQTPTQMNAMNPFAERVLSRFAAMCAKVTADSSRS
jgi:GMP synthase (glutamine-hydrolysing)